MSGKSIEKHIMCALCNSKRKLSKSHLVPKFVEKWLKKTGSGKFRNLSTPDRTQQSLSKLTLLCSECEVRFSLHEKYFSEKFFIPLHKKEQAKYEYDEQLLRFVISMTWRALKAYKLSNSQLFHLDLIDKRLQILREILLGKRHLSDAGEYHILFLGNVLKRIPIIPTSLHWMLNRSSRPNVIVGQPICAGCVIIPGIVFIAPMHPPTITGWQGTRIFEKGSISLDQSVNDQEFAFYLGKIWHEDLQKLGTSRDSKWLSRVTRQMEVERSRFALQHWQWRIFDALRNSNYFEIEDDITALMKSVEKNVLCKFIIHVESIKSIDYCNTTFTDIEGIWQNQKKPLKVRIRGNFSLLHPHDTVAITRMKGYSVSLLETIT